MRHLVKGRKLGRTASHRKATLMALSVALIKNERIVTTLAKAKALRSYVEPIINRSKEDSTHNRSHVFRNLQDKQATSRLFDEIAPMVEDRQGGYTRIVKLGVRPGDGVEKALIELVDFNDAPPESARKKKRRTRRGAGSKKASETQAGASVKGKTKSKPAKEKTSEDKKPAAPDAVPPVAETEKDSEVKGQKSAETDASAKGKGGSSTKEADEAPMTAAKAEEIKVEDAQISSETKPDTDAIVDEDKKADAKSTSSDQDNEKK